MKKNIHTLFKILIFAPIFLIAALFFYVGIDQLLKKIYKKQELPT